MANSVVIIAGTPGVGKTSLAKVLAGIFNAKHIDLSELTISKKLFSYYDEERESYVINENAVVDEVLKLVKSEERIIIDTHYPEILPSSIVDKVIVLRLNPLILEERLRRKNWSWKKIRENVLAEILSVVSINAIEKFGPNKVYEIDATGKSINEIAEIAVKIISGEYGHKQGTSIDWLEKLPLDIILRYERKEA